MSPEPFLSRTATRRGAFALAAAFGGTAAACEVARAQENPVQKYLQDTLQMLRDNQIYDVVDAEVLVKPSYIHQYRTNVPLYTYPDFVNGVTRSVQDLGNGVSRGVPHNADKKLVVTLPEGKYPVLIKRMGQRVPGAQKVLQDWVFYPLRPDEQIVFENCDGSGRIVGGGAFAFPLNWENPGGEETTIVMNMLVFPEGSR